MWPYMFEQKKRQYQPEPAPAAQSIDWQGRALAAEKQIDVTNSNAEKDFARLQNEIRCRDNRIQSLREVIAKKDETISHLETVVNWIQSVSLAKDAGDLDRALAEIKNIGNTSFLLKSDNV